MYQETRDELTEQINAFLGRYIDRESITYHEAMLRLSKTDVTRLQRRAAKYVQEKDFSDEANEMLKRYNLKMRLSRAEALRYEMNLALIALGDREAKTTQAYLMAQYVEEIRRQAGILGMSETRMRQLVNDAATIVNGSWRGATFSERVWRNNEDLRARLETGLRKTLMQGRNTREWAKSLLSILNKETIPKRGKDSAIYRAERLAITEAGRMQISAQLASFHEMGYDALEIITEPGACPYCKPHDGEIVPLNKAVMGETIPIFHPFCRCSTAAAVEDGEKNSTNSAHSTEKEGIIPTQTGAKNYWRDTSLDQYRTREEIRQDKFAHVEYDRIKNNNQTIEKDKIYRNIQAFPEMEDFTREDVEIAFNHVFNDLHELEDGIGLFKPDPDMAHSWRRLIHNDGIQPHDLILLRHERLERDYMLYDGMDYWSAHHKTEETYRYTPPPLREKRRKKKKGD